MLEAIQRKAMPKVNTTTPPTSLRLRVRRPELDEVAQLQHVEGVVDHPLRQAGVAQEHIGAGLVDPPGAP